MYLKALISEVCYLRDQYLCRNSNLRVKDFQTWKLFILADKCLKGYTLEQ